MTDLVFGLLVGVVLGWHVPAPFWMTAFLSKVKSWF